MILISEETHMLASDLLASNRDLAQALQRNKELEAIVYLKDKEITALSHALDRALSTKRAAAFVIAELQDTVKQIGSREVRS